MKSYGEVIETKWELANRDTTYFVQGHSCLVKVILEWDSKACMFHLLKQRVTAANLSALLGPILHRCVQQGWHSYFRNLEINKFHIIIVN